MVWSMWSTIESHRKMTVRERLTVGTHHAHGCMHAMELGEVNVVKERLPSEVYCTWRVSARSTAAASKCLLITRKIMIPPTDSRDPLDGLPYFSKKNVCPLTAGTHLTGHRISQKKNVPPAVSSDPPEVPPYYAQKMNTPLLAGTLHSGRLTCGPTKLTGTKGFVNLFNMNDSSSSDRTMSIQRP